MATHRAQSAADAGVLACASCVPAQRTSTLRPAACALRRLLSETRRAGQMPGGRHFAEAIGLTLR